MKIEKILKPVNGYLMLAILFIASILLITIFVKTNNLISENPLGTFIYSMCIVISVVLLVFLATGLIVVNPNSSRVLVLFGAYSGSVKQNGLFWVNPFCRRINLSLRARNFESEKIKVNDKMGNPILISVILVWKVDDTFKASFEVDSYENFVRIQTDSAVRKLAGSFPYDHFEDERASITLSTNFDDVNKTLEQEISDRMHMAGIEVIESRIGYLAYAPEIAHSMLRRQQASAVVAARHKIVEGAVGMVESALNLLSSKHIIDLDEEKKAAMVSNLMVVLCGDNVVEPVINTGTLHQ